eukprot:scaffold81974_cov19-Tisochrysis_lutea.AAC.1
MPPTPSSPMISPGPGNWAAAEGLVQGSVGSPGVHGGAHGAGGGAGDGGTGGDDGDAAGRAQPLDRRPE